MTWKTILAGSAIEGLAGLFGASKSASAANRLRRQQQRQFDESMDNTILRRTRDARRAGIHPLAALGASPGAGPTLTGAGIGAEGEGIARAGAAVGRGISGKAIADATLAEINSRADLNEATAAFYRSQAATRASTNPGTSGGELDENPMGRAIYESPRIAKSKSTGVTAGLTPRDTEYVRPDGSVGRMFNPDLGADEINQVRLATAEYNNWAHRKNKFVGPIDDARWKNRVSRLSQEYARLHRYNNDPEFRRKVDNWKGDTVRTVRGWYRSFVREWNKLKKLVR